MGISAPSFITVGDVVRGSNVLITWSAVSNAVGYVLQRSVNGVAFGTNSEDTVNNTAGTDTVDTAGENWNTVQYRVRAWGYSDDGFRFVDSDWTVSEVKTASSAPGQTPTPSGDRLEQFQNSNGTNIYPKTVVEGVFRQSDGKSLEQILMELEPSVAGSGVPTGGTAGQVLAKKTGADYDTEWIDAPSSGGTTEPGAGGVTSFNGRTGAVTPQSGDYTAAQVGAVPTSRKINGQALSGDITLITCGTADLTAGSSSLAAGTLYGVY